MRQAKGKKLMPINLSLCLLVRRGDIKLNCFRYSLISAAPELHYGGKSNETHQVKQNTKPGAT
jgi:hypothetical protein